MSNSRQSAVVADGEPSMDNDAVDASVQTDGEENIAKSSWQALDLRVEAILFSTDHPQTVVKLAALLEESVKNVLQAIKRLNQHYLDTHRSFCIEQVARGWQIMTKPEYADLMAAVHKSKTATRLTPAALETLAIIAYEQPILRAQIEVIRGVASGEVIRGLMDRRLVKIVGRAQELGRPMLYGTTSSFLEVFGLASIKDLPKVQ